MANYKGHSLLNIFLILPLCAGGLHWWFHPHIHVLSTFVGVFTYSTLFMSPDLDLCYSINPWSLRGILCFPFRTYARVFSHRGISHSIFLGTLTRIIWLAGFVVGFFLLAYLVVPEKYIGKVPDQAMFKAFFIKYKLYLYYGMGGVVCADLGHLLVDHEYDKLWP